LSTAPGASTDGPRRRSPTSRRKLLIANPEVSETDSYKNKDYAFYALKKFIILTHESYGTVGKFQSACWVD
jgi:hypothetical protein